jgi:hypothetical protein
MLVLVFMQTFEFFVKKMNISGSKVDNLFVCYSMVLCFSIAVMSACLLTAVLVVCECAVMADSGNPVIPGFVGCIISRVFIAQYQEVIE